MQEPMNIGIDISILSMAMGGSVTYTRSLVQNLVSIGDSTNYTLVHVAPGRFPKSELAVPSSNPRVKILGSTTDARLVRKYPRLLRPLLWRAEAAVRSYTLKNQLRDLNVFHSSEVFLWDNRPRKNVITMHDITTRLFPQFHTEKNIKLHERKIAFAQQFAHKVVAISLCTSDDLMRHCGIPADKIQVIYNGCDHSTFRIYNTGEVANVLQRHHLLPGYILHVGTIEPRKNIERLIEAFEILTRMPGMTKIRLVLAGATGWLSDEIFRVIDASELRGRIVLTGRLPDEDLPYIYNGACVFVYPSLYEGFGLPVVEAMACGVPVVTSDGSSLPEIVGNAGMLVDPHNAEGLATAMYKVLSDQNLREQMIQKSQQRAQLFSWEKTAREMLKTYKEVANA